MVNLAKQRGGEDNITVVIVEYGHFTRNKKNRLGKAGIIAGKKRSAKKKLLILILLMILSLLLGLLFFKLGFINSKQKAEPVKIEKNMKNRLTN